jgi:S-DNA-T family DNA segregation ATPase FtsK/SpoIIIE
LAQNAGGIVGAWLADLLLYLFGLSAYWLAVLAGMGVLWGYKRFEARAVGIALGGFALLLFASASLEGLRLHSLAAALPLAPGGVVGEVLGNGLAGALGERGEHRALRAALHHQE